MFKSPEQAESYFASLAFYNQYVGEFVVMTFYYIDVIGRFVGSF
jgi:hypothetical protein